MRLPTARRPGHPFREPGHRVEQRPLAGMREQARLEPLRIRPRQAEVSGLPERGRGVSVRVPHSIGGIAQVLRGHGPGVELRSRRPGHAAREPAEREPDGVLPRVREGPGDRAGPPRSPGSSPPGRPAPAAASSRAGPRPGDLGARGSGQPPGQLRGSRPRASGQSRAPASRASRGAVTAVPRSATLRAQPGRPG